MYIPYIKNQRGTASNSDQIRGSSGFKSKVISKKFKSKVKFNKTKYKEMESGEESLYI